MNHRPLSSDDAKRLLREIANNPDGGYPGCPPPTVKDEADWHHPEDVRNEVTNGAAIFVLLAAVVVGVGALLAHVIIPAMFR